MTRRGVPAVAAWLFQRVLPPRHRDAVVGDLQEEYDLRASTSPSGATRWYWSQVCRSVPNFLLAEIRGGNWPATVGVALGSYVVVGMINFGGQTMVTRLFGATADRYGLSGVAVGLTAIAAGGFLAASTRRGASTVLGIIVALVAVLFMASPSDTAPRWYQVTFLVLGPIAAAAGSIAYTRLRRDRMDDNQQRTLCCVAIILAIGIGGPRGQVPNPRNRLLAAKAALYDGNFRNDQTALRAAIGQAVESSNDGSLRPLALYYAAWGEWALSHSRLQAGDLAGARESLIRCERHARAALALRADDPEFVVMLADALIWRIIADPKVMIDLGAEVQQLRARALALAPDNPRAVIMDAGLIFNTPSERGGSREVGLARWQRAIDLFEREAASSRDDLRPDWGLALSYAWVCDLYLSMRPRQVDAARAAARKALALYPDFWYVREVVMPRLE